MRPDLSAVPLGRLFWLGLFAVLRAVGLVLVAEAIARGIAGVQAGELDTQLVLWLGAAGAVLRAGAGWATQVAAHRVASEVKRSLRARLWRRIAEGGRAPKDGEGGVVALASAGLDDLDDYYTQSLPAMIAAVAVPAVVGLRILGADWVSALIVVLTLPLIPVFMILIGLHTQERTDEATGALTRLADHLTELARGLPVLVGLGRVEEQTRALDRVQRDYRERTIATLRTAFLSALALELIATLSVAVVAVFLGLRLLYGTVELTPALLALILAPEIYAAVRDVGAAFHASQSGLSALERVKALLAGPGRADVRMARTGTTEDVADDLGDEAAVPPVRVRALTVRYAGRVEATLDRLDAAFAGITAVTGRSGAGKSTLLAALAGVLPADAEATGVVEAGASVAPAPGGAGVAWAPQAPRAFAETPREELSLYGAADPAAALAELGLGRLADAAVAELSPGELRRLAVARALARVDAGARLLVLDEPTAHLDAASASRVRAAILRRAAAGTTVVLATHEPETLALATTSVEIGGDAPCAQQEDASLPPAASGRQSARAEARPRWSDDPPTQPRAARLPSATARGRARSGRPRSGTRPALWHWAGAIALGVVASGLGLSLTGVSGWLIVRASVEEYIMYLLVAIVGVRFFGLGRSVARYLERLATHDAAFRDIDALRLRLWRAIASRGAGSRRLLDGGAPLDYLITQANALRDQLPRTIPPILVGVASAAGITIAVTFVAPPLALVTGAVLLVAAAAGSALALLAARGSGAAGAAARSDIVRGTASLASAADDLRGNGVAGRPGDGHGALAGLDEAAARLAGAEARAAWSAGIGTAAATLLTSALAAAVAPLALRHGLAAEPVAVVALLALASLEPLAGLIAAVHRLPTLRAALRRVAPVLEQAPEALTGDADLEGPIGLLALRGLAARYPTPAPRARRRSTPRTRRAGTPPAEAARPVFSDVTASVRRGDWLVVDGPSGSGKSTLLSVLMGALPPAAGSVTADGVDIRLLAPTTWRRRVAWCPQDAYVFDSTLRGNLLLARGRDDAPTDREQRDALERAGLGELLRRLPDGLGTRVGAGGSALSGGERQRLAVARALLSRADVLLLDEPTAHLDAPTAADMMRDLRSASAGRITVLVSHRATDHAEGDRRIRLG